MMHRPAALPRLTLALLLGLPFVAPAMAQDIDGDGTVDHEDNCPLAYNPEQADFDEDDLGDDCLCGDVNGDGVKNVVDALAIARGEVPSADPNFAKCDVDGNRLCNVTDALLIARGEVGSAHALQKCPAYLGITFDPESGPMTGMTRAHNELRATLGLPPLSWDESLIPVAQSWADNCSFTHNPNRGFLGENIAAFAPPGHTGPEASDLWESEGEWYNYPENTCDPSCPTCGHYTQQVWRNTETLGCGFQVCDTGSPFGPANPIWEIWVCNYSPPGNFVGQLPY